MSLRRLVALSFPLTLSLGVAAACSGKTDEVTSQGDASTSTGDAAAGDAATGKRAVGCPEAMPTTGTACSKPDLLCEYGDDVNPHCNALFVCSTTRWAQPITYGERSACPTPPPVPNPSDCPAQAPAPGTCTSSDSRCQYDEKTCFCGVNCRSYPIQQQDCNPDAGITTSCCDRSKVEWVCYSGFKQCQAPRPAIGTPCKEGDQPCSIGPAKECGQAVVECREGIWNTANTTCPSSTARHKAGIDYVDEAAAERLHEELMQVRLATYRYKTNEDARHLGFIIEDMPPASAAVMAAGDRVDLYGYASMAVASLQKQQRTIDALEARLARLEAENAKLRTKPAR